MRLPLDRSALLALLAGAVLGGTLPAQVMQPRDFRGTNYFCNTTDAIDNVVGMLPASSVPLPYGYYKPAHVEREIARIAASGLNNIRLMPSFYAWVGDRVGYMTNLRHLARTCNEHGVTITYTLWTAIGLTHPATARDGQYGRELWHELIGSDPSALTNPLVVQGAFFRANAMHAAFVAQGGGLPPGEPHFSSVHLEPGNELIAMGGDHHAWPYQMGRRIDAYLDEIARFFTTDPAGAQAFASYDLMNEPNGLQPQIPLAPYIEFMARTWDRLHSLHPGAAFTIGWAGAGPEVDLYDQQAVAAGIGRTYLSFHSYAHGRPFDADVSARASYGNARGLQSVVSEFYRADWNAGSLSYSLATLSREGVGAQMWGFLQGNCFHPFGHLGFQPIDGIYVPVLTGNPADPVAFVPNNPADTRALHDWIAGIVDTRTYTAVHVTDLQGAPAATLAPNGVYDIAVTSSRTGDPGLLLVTVFPNGLPPQALTSFLVPGAGFTIFDPTSVPLPLDPMPATGTLPLGRFGVHPSLAGSTVTLSAYVGIYPGLAFAQNEGELTEVYVFDVL